MGWTFTESSPAHRSSPFGPDWTQNFDRISGLGLDGQIFWLGWTDWTFIWNNDSGLDWAGPNFVNGPGLLAYSRTIKMHAQLSNMPYFDPNFLRFDHLHQFYPFQVSPNVSKCNFVAKKNGKINFLSATRHDSRTTFHPIVRRHRSSVVNVISRQLSSTV